MLLLVFCFFCLVSAASAAEIVKKCGECDEAQMKRRVRELKRKEVRCCSRQIKLNTMFLSPPTQPNPRLLPFILHLSLPPSPASSLHSSFFISPGLSVPGQKDPATVFSDRAPGREVDVVAKVMTTAIRKHTQMHPDVQVGAHIYIYIYIYIYP